MPGPAPCCTPDEVAEVAFAARAAAGLSMLAEVSAEFSVSRSRASQLLRAARQAGHALPIVASREAVSAGTKAGMADAGFTIHPPRPQRPRRQQGRKEPCTHCGLEFDVRGLPVHERTCLEQPIALVADPAPSRPRLCCVCDDCDAAYETAVEVARHTITVHRRGPHRSERTPRAVA